MTNFKPFLVPVDHIKFLGEPFHISVDIRDLNLTSTHNQTACQVQRWLISLLDELVISIECIHETLIDIPWQKLWVYQVVQWRETRLQEVHFGKWNHIHSYFI